MEVKNNAENTVNNNDNNEVKKKTSAEILLEQMEARTKGTATGAINTAKELKAISKTVEQEASPDTKIEKATSNQNDQTSSTVDYSTLTREELLEELQQIVGQPVNTIRRTVEQIRNFYYKLHNSETKEQLEEFLKSGGNKEDFKEPEDDTYKKFKELMDTFKAEKQKFNEEQELIKKERIAQKYLIIDKIDAIVDKGETTSNTFDEFQKLRKEWESLHIPQSDLRLIIDKYNYVLQKFYDWIKINKELRDLDLKRNLDQKIKICEQVETLILEPKIIKAYKTLQEYHDKWKEIGPVPQEQKEPIWQRFKEASSIINKKHFSYFESVQQQQKDNLKAKELLCEEAEKIVNEEKTQIKIWQEKTDQINELMKLWKMIGFAPKKHNTSIFDRFMNARNKFFEQKHDFFQGYTEILDENLAAKQKIIEEAKQLKDSTEWQKTTNVLISLQKKWKTIGPVKNDKREEIWVEFNSICNHFFETKRNFFNNRKQEEQKNLEEKKALLKRIREYDITTIDEDYKTEIANIRREWNSIGFIPYKHKDTIYNEFKEEIIKLTERFKEQNQGLIEKRQAKNLELRKQIIEKVRAVENKEDKEQLQKEFEAIHKEWQKAGKVNKDEKHNIMKLYREAIDAKHAEFGIGSHSFDENFEHNERLKRVISYNDPYKISNEIEKIKNKIALLNSEIVTIENNLTFFVKTKKTKKSGNNILENLENKLKDLKNQKELEENMLLRLVKAQRKNKDN